MDLERLTPVEQAVKRRKWIRFWVIAILVVLAVYYLLFENTYVVAYDDDRQHFMYGSIGSEIANGIPYWVFKALPELYKEKLGPNGYRRFGLLYESDTAELPMSLSHFEIEDEVHVHHHVVPGDVFLSGHPVYLLSGVHQAPGVHDGNQKPEPGLGDSLKAAPLHYHQPFVLLNYNYA